ncbi:hypothetical protein F5887DRAFT_987417 [Amanita rubescens]|nr:hypothetical protein F5887DRAFT_987417 [Amanita rubescens]
MLDLGPRHHRVAKRQGPPGGATSQATPPSTPTGPSTTQSNPTGNPTSTQTANSTSKVCLVGDILCQSPSSSTSASSTKSASSTSSHAQTTSSVSTSAPPAPSLPPLTGSLTSTGLTTISSGSATATSSATNSDSGPIAGGVIGGLFAVALVGMLISSLLRRWRQKRIDKAIFDSTDFRRSAVVLDDASAENIAQKQHYNPRPPTMIEKRIAGGQQRSFGGGTPPPPQAYGGYGQPFYPPQSMQRGYYPQQAVHVPGGYNQMYAGGYGPQVAPPSRTQTPLHQQVAPPLRTQTPLHQQDPMGLPNPFGARIPIDSMVMPGAMGRRSGGEGPPTYG